MSRITSYTAALSLDSSDRFLIDGTSGSRSISASNLAAAMLGFRSAIDHRNIWRGSYLGSSVSTAQNTSLSSGTFDNLFVGDYWTVDSVNWRIIDINYFYNTGNLSAFTSPHLVLTTDSYLYNASMEDTDTTENGYNGSAMVLSNLANAINAADSAFGSYLHLLSDYQSDTVADGEITSGGWVNTKVILPNEISIFGVSHGLSEYTILSQQFAGFRLNPSYANIRGDYWTRDIASDEDFVIVTSTGGVDSAPASSQYGVRPIIVIKAVS